ncbi:hypothetical protein C8F04DRAFT_1254317 [Mycena alexandri]|uniref:Uncharacterized protein n=1 Tax=Mycena alexandri TaxID=1745969 RepID=A0AAD6T6P8_9AGAR|nr:hypothetical protein C8F04DRAFT_1254317 [Mycena alexandri]
MPSPSPSHPRARLRPASPSFLSLVVPALAYTTAAHLRRGSSRRAAPSHLTSPLIVPVSLVPICLVTHPTPSLVVPRPRIRTHAAPARALPSRGETAPVAVCANSHSAGTQLRMRVESPRAGTASPARVREMRADADSYLHCAARHRALALPAHPPALAISA